MVKKAKAKAKRKKTAKVKPMTLEDYAEKILKPMTEKMGVTYTPGPMALCGQLEDAILLLETRISNSIAKINSLM